MSGAKYVPLWCKSHFSFLEGASSPEELVETCHAFELPAVALTDRDGVYGVVEAHQKARELGLHLLIGSEVTLEDGFSLVLLAQDQEGYRHLCRLITRGRLRSDKGQSAVALGEVCEHAGHLLALWGGQASSLAAEAETADRHAALLCEAFGDRLYAMLARHLEPIESELERRVRMRASRYALPLVAAIEVLYHTPERRRLQDVLSCIRHRVTLARAGRRIKPNDEHALIDAAAFEARFADVPEAVRRSVEVAERCRFSLADLRYRYPAERLPDGSCSHQWLRQLAFEGAERRYQGQVPRDVEAQLERELEVIRQLDYDGYFLTMWEIVCFCEQNDILCQGRGSAANSVVCYCLGITAIDPVRMGLLFERFLSRERAEPPDIDLDIEHDRREEVIQHVYDKYGREHAAMVANVIRYRGKSAVRDVGKSLGMSQTSLDRLAKMVSHYDGVDAEVLKNAGLDPTLPRHRHLLSLVSEIQDCPRHLSIHPGGFLLGHEPVHDLVPIENATMPGRTVIQWSKDDIEALGLFKVDLLGLGALRQLHLGFDLVRRHHGRDLSMASIPHDDPPTYAAISRGDTVGVFQIESRAQMAMLPRLKPRYFYDLVVEISIVRPGPIVGGMVHPYLKRRNGEEAVEYPHPSLVPVLEKTLGVPLFQEQVMRLAVVAADYTPGEADQLRRDMAAWRRSGRIEKHRERLITRMRAKGIEARFAERVFDQIRGFGEYGFPESHAASFALISYASAWLKQHYPEAFACALLNAQPMGFYSPATIVEDAKRHGVEMLPVDVTRSRWDCSLEPLERGGAFGVRMGLRYVKGLGERERRQLEAAAPFASLQGFVRQTSMQQGALEALAEAGAFDRLLPGRRDALWEVLRAKRAPDLPLTGARAQRPLPFAPLDGAEEVRWDLRASAHSTRGHPLSALRRELARRGLPDARTVARLQHGQQVRYVGLVICRQRPSTASGVVFMTLEDETGFVNAVIWQQIFQKYALVAKTAPLLGIRGEMQVQHGVSHLIARTLWRPELSEHLTPAARSRDFH